MQELGTNKLKIIHNRNIITSSLPANPSFQDVNRKELNYIDWFFFKTLLYSFSRNSEVWMLMEYWNRFVVNLKFTDKKEDCSLPWFLVVMENFAYISYFRTMTNFFLFICENNFKEKAFDQGVVGLKDFMFQLEKTYELYSVVLQKGGNYYLNEVRVTSKIVSVNVLFPWNRFGFKIENLKSSFTEHISEILNECQKQYIYSFYDIFAQLQISEIIREILSDKDCIDCLDRVYFDKCNIFYGLNQNFEENKMLGFFLGITFMQLLGAMLVENLPYSVEELEILFNHSGNYPFQTMKNIFFNVLRHVEFYSDFLQIHVYMSKDYKYELN